MKCWHELRCSSGTLEFTSGRESAELISHSGHPRTSRTKNNKNMNTAFVAEDPLIRIKKLSTGAIVTVASEWYLAILKKLLYAN